MFHSVSVTVLGFFVILISWLLCYGLGVMEFLLRGKLIMNECFLEYSYDTYITDHKMLTALDGFLILMCIIAVIAVSYGVGTIFVE